MYSSADACSSSRRNESRKVRQQPETRRDVRERDHTTVDSGCGLHWLRHHIRDRDPLHLPGAEVVLGGAGLRRDAVPRLLQRLRRRPNRPQHVLQLRQGGAVHRRRHVRQRARHLSLPRRLRPLQVHHQRLLHLDARFQDRPPNAVVAEGDAGEPGGGDGARLRGVAAQLLPVLQGVRHRQSG